MTIMQKHLLNSTQGFVSYIYIEHGGLVDTHLNHVIHPEATQHRLFLSSMVSHYTNEYKEMVHKGMAKISKDPPPS